VRRLIEFEVEGELPPKKDGAKSMWAKPAEVPRLIALRRAALAAIGSGTPLSRDIVLRLEVRLPPKTAQRHGDLDNFVTGICDGLMTADPRASLDARWGQLDLKSIAPSCPIGIMDDDSIIEIQAVKSYGHARPGYRVTLEGE